MGAYRNHFLLRSIVTVSWPSINTTCVAVTLLTTTSDCGMVPPSGTITVPSLVSRMAVLTGPMITPTKATWCDRTKLERGVLVGVGVTGVGGGGGVVVAIGGGGGGGGDVVELSGVGVAGSLEGGLSSLGWVGVVGVDTTAMLLGNSGVAGLIEVSPGSGSVEPCGTTSRRMDGAIGKAPAVNGVGMSARVGVAAGALICGLAVVIAAGTCLTVLGFGVDICPEVPGRVEVVVPGVLVFPIPGLPCEGKLGRGWPVPLI